MLPPRVFIVLARDEAQDRFEVARAAQRAFEGAGFAVQTVRTVSATSSVPEEGNRPLQILRARDSHAIYQAAHQGPVAVLSNGKARVRSDVHGPLTFRRTMTLQRFVRYKAVYRALHEEDAARDLIDALMLWPGEEAFSDERDHRVLPLHVFSRTDWAELHLDAGIASFERAHGRAAHLVDYSDRDWVRPSAFHGKDVLHLRGMELRAGHHWDVQSTRSAGRMSTHLEVWSFPRGAYVNVYPNAVVRSGQSSGTSATPIWDELGAENQKKSRVTPKNTPRRRDNRRAH